MPPPSAPDPLTVLVRAADVVPARGQMAFSLGWHIVIACFGVAFPALILFVEWRGQRTGDAAYALLAKRWARAAGVLFAVGAVSGTILSFEMGTLWPGLIQRFGQVFGFPFALEGFAFFIEAIFLGVYLYGWDRLPPRTHLLSGVPVVVGGIASAFFVVAANSWMNAPTGFSLVDGRVTDPHPWAALFNPATGPETTHMLLAAFMVTGFGVASVYAVAMLRGRSGRYYRLGLLVPLTVAAVAAPAQVIVGDWAARFVATDQPAKLGAMEGLYRTESGAALHIFGWYTHNQLHGSISIPYGLSLLLHGNPHGVVQGLQDVPPDQRPPVTVTHLSFDVMVGLGFALVLLGLWFAWAWWRRREIPAQRVFLWAVAGSGVAATAAMEAGWVVTEVGRQPWIVWQLMRVSQAVNPQPGVVYGFYGVLALYALLTVATVWVLRLLAGRPVPLAPQEQDVAELSPV